jgi:hypothetical protein
MISTIVVFIIRAVLSAFCLWAGMKLTKVKGAFHAMLIIAAVSSLIGLIPMVGWILGSVIMFVLICKWTDANFWPDAVLMVLVAEVVAILLSGLLVNI